MIRKAAWKLAPGVMADRARRYESKLRDEWGLPVASGPFIGMRYPRDLRGVDHPLDKLVGCYELEIQPAVELLLNPLKHRLYLRVGRPGQTRWRHLPASQLKGYSIPQRDIGAG